VSKSVCKINVKSNPTATINHKPDLILNVFMYY
jgi:hypothetical protein